MSLIGSLEDLGLGDILQIISLSQKSGVLAIRGEDGEGSILLRDGLVRSATLKGGPVDLRGVLVGGRFLDPEEFDHADERARRDGTTLEEAITASSSLTQERIDALRRECVEAAVMAMFAWQCGEFSFDVQAPGEMDEPSLLLPMGINAQYLAMEGSRIEDESTHIRQEWQGETGRVGEPAVTPEETLDPLFGISGADALDVDEFDEHLGDEDLDPDDTTMVQGELVAEAVEAVGIAVAERVEAELGDESLVLGEEIGEVVPAEPLEQAEPLERAEPLEQAEPLEEEVAAAPAVSSLPAAAAALPNAPLVVIDPDLVALEWMKHTLRDAFPRVHIFQRWDLGLNPIRQYLARANRPVVLLHHGASGDPLSGIRNGQDFVARLKAQQPRLPILWLRESDGPRLDDVGAADAVLTRASAQQLRTPRAAAQLGELAERLRQQLATVLSGQIASSTESHARGPGGAGGQTPDELRRLQEVTASLAEASTRGEALPIAIRFASEIFDRVAMFMVRGNQVAGMAQHGLEAAGGPDDEALRRVELSSEGSAWLRNVLAQRRPLRSGPTDGGDYTLAALLGSAAASEAYTAPIEASGEVVAVLYADNLPSRRPLGDTKALEVVLQHVGLALERTMLARALAEAQSASDA